MIGARNALSTEEAAMRAITDNVTIFAYVMTSVAFGPVHLGTRVGHVADRRRALNLDGRVSRSTVSA